MVKEGQPRGRFYHLDTTSIPLQIVQVRKLYRRRRSQVDPERIYVKTPREMPQEASPHSSQVSNHYGKFSHLDTLTPRRDSLITHPGEPSRQTLDVLEEDDSGDFDESDPDIRAILKQMINGNLVIQMHVSLISIS
jgi:hypothetical protein